MSVDVKWNGSVCFGQIESTFTQMILNIIIIIIIIIVIVIIIIIALSLSLFLKLLPLT